MNKDTMIPVHVKRGTSHSRVQELTPLAKLIQNQLNPIAIVYKRQITCTILVALVFLPNCNSPSCAICQKELIVLDARTITCSLLPCHIHICG